MKPTVSFVIPAYNVAALLSGAVESVLAQTVADWELIICDDASTDATADIAARYAAEHPNIRLVRRSRNSGCALVPRLEAIAAARGEWIAPLDADDKVEPDYLTQLLSRAREEQADIVYPTMWVGGTRRYVPAPDFDYATRPGRDCVILTLNTWKICTNGGIIRRSLYDTVSTDPASLPAGGVFSDEAFDLPLLFNAPRVAFSPAKYLYHPNEGSVTLQVAPSFFGFIDSDSEIIDFIRKNYPADSPTRLAAERHLLRRTIAALIFLSGDKHLACRADRRKVLAKISRARRNIRFDLAPSDPENRRLRFTLRHLGPYATYALLRLRPLLPPRCGN